MLQGGTHVAISALWHATWYSCSASAVGPPEPVGSAGGAGGGGSGASGSRGGASPPPAAPPPGNIAPLCAWASPVSTRTLNICTSTGCSICPALAWSPRQEES